MTTSYAADVPSIKVEGHSQTNLGVVIKQDPDELGNSPAALSEEDIYEDAGDLDFTGSDQSVYLTRIPRSLWECWSKLDDDQELTIGRIRVEGQSGDIKRMSLMLDAGVPKNKNVPKEYNLHITNPDSLNTFVFSEKDLPGFRQFTSDRAPTHWLNRKRVERNRSHAPSYRKAIPKQTRMTGQVKTEINCLPVENDEYHRIQDQRALLALRPKGKTKLLNTVMPGTGSILNPGVSGPGGDFTNFINRGAPPRRKGQTLKAARMEEVELMDNIFRAFEEYTYWPFKVLNERLQQPEQYLRETLNKIAFQAKSGTHMMEWQLKPESKFSTYADARDFEQAKDEVAPEEAEEADPQGGGGVLMGGGSASFDGMVDGDIDVDDDFDENVDMEDVL